MIASKIYCAINIINSKGIKKYQNRAANLQLYVNKL